MEGRPEVVEVVRGHGADVDHWGAFGESVSGLSAMESTLFVGWGGCKRTVSENCCKFCSVLFLWF